MLPSGSQGDLNDSSVSYRVDNGSRSWQLFGDDVARGSAVVHHATGARGPEDDDGASGGVWRVLTPEVCSVPGRPPGWTGGMVPAAGGGPRPAGGQYLTRGCHPGSGP